MIIFLTFPAQGVARLAVSLLFLRQVLLFSQSSLFNLLWSQLTELLALLSVNLGGALVEQGVDLIKTHKDPHLHSFMTHQLCWPEGWASLPTQD